MQKDIITNIKKSISEFKMVRVYFKLEHRSPLFGKFVRCDDYEELLKKGFIRFVPESWAEAFDDTGHIVLTKLFAVESFFDIKIY